MYVDRRPEIGDAYGLLGTIADATSWPGTPWSPAASVWSAVTGRNETGLGGTTVGGPPSSPAAVASQGRGHPPCLARGAVEPGLAREGAAR